MSIKIFSTLIVICSTRHFNSIFFSSYFLHETHIKYNSFLTLHFRARNATQGFERVHVLVFVGLFVLGVRLAALQVLVRVRVPERLRLERRVLGLEILFVLEYGTLPRPPRSQSTYKYIEYRAVSGVFRTIDPPPPLHLASVSSSPPPPPKPGGGGGGQYFGRRQTLDWPLTV
jgi:hypothetical protein